MLENYNIILASKSPRRKELLAKLDLSFEQKTKDTDESFPTEMTCDEVAEFISIKKSKAFKDELNGKNLIITSDTVVVLNNEILTKANSKEEAVEMLKKLSASEHKVITGVCISSSSKQISFSTTTKVHFKALSNNEIEHYVNKYQPFDKAGSYGIQEWIGCIGVKKIEGCFYNVMGLPLHDLHQHLSKF